MTMERLEDFSCDLLAEFLEEKGLHQDIISAIIRNRISGPVFLALSEEDIKELLPVIGDRVSLRKVLMDAHKVIYHCW